MSTDSVYFDDVDQDDALVPSNETIAIEAARLELKCASIRDRFNMSTDDIVDQCIRAAVNSLEARGRLVA